MLIRSGTVTVPSVFVFSLEIGSRLLNPLRRFSSNWAALLCASGLAATCASGYSVSSSVLCVSGAWNPSVFCSTKPHYGNTLTARLSAEPFYVLLRTFEKLVNFSFQNRNLRVSACADLRGFCFSVFTLGKDFVTNLENFSSKRAVGYNVNRHFDLPPM